MSKWATIEIPEEIRKSYAGLKEDNNFNIDNYHIVFEGGTATIKSKTLENEKPAAIYGIKDNEE